MAPYGSVTQNVPTPVVGWLGESSQEMTLWQAIRNDTVVSPIYPFAGPNQPDVPAHPEHRHGAAQIRLLVCGLWSRLDADDLLPESERQVRAGYPARHHHRLLQLEHAGSPGIDWDGDGVPATTNPNDRRNWDTDGDGLPDGVERARRPGCRRSADADVDRDGLADADEVRYGTTTARADTDGDGISDLDEVKGYAITTDGLTSLTQSDPAPPRHRPGRHQRRRRAPPQQPRPGALSLPSPGLQ